jgi:hypothetical protein
MPPSKHTAALLLQHMTLGYEAVPLNELAVPNISICSTGLWIKRLLGLVDRENEGSTILRNVESTAVHPMTRHIPTELNKQ